MTFEEIWQNCLNLCVHQKKEELHALYDLFIDKKLNKCLEIGTLFGGNIPLWLNLFDEVTCVDYAKKENIDSLLKSNSKLSFHHTEFNKYTSAELFDFIFIDGDHHILNVRQDFEKALTLIKPNGIIGLHDIVDPLKHWEDYEQIWHLTRDNEVHILWNEIKDNYSHIEIISNIQNTHIEWMNHVNPKCWGGIGLIWI